VPADWRFIIMPSGVEAAKAGAARTRYNRASLATQALADVWRRHAGDADVRPLAQVLAAGDGTAAALRGAIARIPHPDFSGEALDRRLAHFVAEDARVLPALAAFHAGDCDQLGALSSASQADAESLLGNQVAETSTLAALAREACAFAASSFGAGFGGSVWALAGEDEAEAVTARWRDAYGARFPALATATAAIVRPGAAALMFDFHEWKIES
jgi:galactokinase